VTGASATDRVVIVTGGGSGIGAATARLLAADGVTVVVAGRRSEALQRTKDAGAPGARIDIHPADLADPEQIADLVDGTVTTYGRLDGVVANAGAMVTGTIAETSIADWQRAIDVNLTGAFLLARHAIPHLRATLGAFVAVGSIAGLRAPDGAAAYAISKSALGMLVATVAVEEARHGVRANCVNPGWVRTEMADAEMDEFGAVAQLTREQAYTAITQLVPARRPADPDEVARAIRWLLGPESTYVNGASLTIDGGTTVVDPGTAGFDFTITPRG